MPAASRIAERAPSAATRSFAASRVAVGETHIDAIRAGLETRHRVGAKLDAVRLRPLDQRIDQRRILDHVRERLARRDLAAERQIGRPHRVLQLGIGDDHVEDRLRAVGDLVPDADGLEQPPRRRRDRRGARVARVALAERRIGDRDLERIAEPLAQRDGRAPGRQSRRRRSAHRLRATVLGSLCLRHGGSISLRRQSRCLHVLRRSDRPARHPRPRTARGEPVPRHAARRSAGSACSAAR